MEQSNFFTVPSPCVGICSVNENGYCKGCFRSRDERFNWSHSTNEQKRKVILLCKKRYERIIRRTNFAKDVYNEAIKQVESANHQFEFEFDSDIKKELYQAANEEIDFSNVSDKTIDFLFWFLQTIFWPIVASCIATVLINSFEELSIRFEGMNSELEIHQEIKKIPKIDKYKNLWVVTVNNLNFREGPSINDTVISQLFIGDIVDVIDSTDKNWLYIRTDVDDEIVSGWISRKYVIAIN